MMKRMMRTLTLGALVMWSGTTEANAAPAPVEVHVLLAPQIIPASDGLRHLAYELDITNFYSSTGLLKLNALDVYSDGSSHPLAHFGGASLAALLPPGVELEADQTLAVKAGGHAVILVWLTLPNEQPIPLDLKHHIEFKTQSGDIQTVSGVSVAVNPMAPIVLGSPLRGGLWLADEGPGKAQSHHWGSLVADNGQLTIPQRYAIDLFGLDPQGHAVKVPIDKLAESHLNDWVGFDSEVLAVADGVVRDTQTSVQAHDPLSPQHMPNEMTPKALYGNYVILEIAPHVFVHYAHLKTGTVTVKAGDYVKRGDVIGHLGDTGAAGAPHLHIHVSDAAGFAESEGLPFRFSAFTLAGHSNETEVLNNQTDLHLSVSADKSARDVMPLDGDLIGF